MQSMAYKLSISPSAVEDLDEIVVYIARTLDNPAAAAAFLDKVSSCYDRLEAMPYLYEECRDPNLRALGYRRAVIDHYVMVYSVDEPQKTVRILRFFYGARDYEKLI